MRIQSLAAAALLAVLACAAQGQGASPSESQCREMTDSMVRSMKSAPLPTERDRQGARALIQNVEKAVRENRARGLMECQTWAVVAKMVSSQ
jgi:hypothetical protein